MNSPLLTRDEAAEFLRVSASTLSRWARYRIGPPFTRIGRHVRYAVSDLEEFAARNRVEAVAEFLL